MTTYQEVTEQEYLRCEESHLGVCFRCETWTGGIDPGAAAVPCRSCGARSVHGVDQALLLGFLRIQA